MIDPATNLLEISRLRENLSREAVMRVFEHTWLSRYSKPLKVISDRGPEFLGPEFPQNLLEAGIQHKPISALNPQSNGIIERVHQTMAQILRILIEKNRPRNQEERERLIDDSIVTIIHAMRAAAYFQLEYFSPASIAFGRDMILNIPYQVDLILLQQKRQHKIDNVNAKQRCIEY